MNMIIGKRQIILAALVLGLGIAVYLNWQYTSSPIELPVTHMIEEDATYGEAQYVDSTDIAEADEGEIFFVEAKMSRQRARDEAAESLAAMLQDADIGAEQKVELAMRAADLAASIEIEGKIENMIKAKGFSDVMVYYDTRNCDVIVKTDGLLVQEAAQIKDIILRETDMPAENISIIEIY